MSTDNRTTGTKSNEKDEINKLIGKEFNEEQAMRYFNEKYKNKDEVGKYLDMFNKTIREIKTKARKFATALLTKYSGKTRYEIMEIAKKLKKKHEYSDEEFHMFLKYTFSKQNIADTLTEKFPTTPIARALGYNYNMLNGKLIYKDNEAQYVQDILKMKSETDELHKQISYLALIYNSLDAPAITGTFDRNKHNVFNSIHPVIAALFLPKFRVIDNHILIASILDIVYATYNNSQVKAADWELYWDMIFDPNEAACASENLFDAPSPIKDLKLRAELQIELWKQVRELRMGRYYNVDNESFMKALGQCKSNIFDSPDLLFIKDEGTFIKKIFSAFSFRPIIANLLTLGLQQSNVNYNLQAIAGDQITTLPLINVRISPILYNTAEQIGLEDSLKQVEHFVENKMIVAKMRQIVYANNLVVFYVNRRFQGINYGKLRVPYSFTSLPATISGLETINEMLVDAPETISIGDTLFTLESLVVVEKGSLVKEDCCIKEDKKLIVGCSAILIRKNPNSYEKQYLNYDPLNAIHMIEGEKDEKGVFGNPIVMMPETDIMGDEDGFEFAKAKRGTLYFYSSEKCTNSMY